MSQELIYALIAFAIVGSFTPGPNNLMIMASGANFGLKRSIPHMLGIGIGFALMIILVGLGIAGLFSAMPSSYSALKVLSAAYLLWLSWKIANAAPLEMTTDPGNVGQPFTFFQAAAFQWVNPKAWAMSLTAVGAYSTPASPLFSLLIVALVFLVVSVSSVSAWSMLGTQLRRLLTNPQRLRIFNWSCAGLLVATLWPILTTAGMGAK